jgi:hypothetical protein
VIRLTEEVSAVEDSKISFRQTILSTEKKMTMKMMIIHMAIIWNEKFILWIVVK